MITIDLRSVGGKRLHLGSEQVWDFGWRGLGNLVVPMTHAQEQAHACRVLQAPEFRIKGNWQLEGRRYPLWMAAKKVLGRHLKYNWQLTGSCVGAGGGNMAKTQMCVEIAAGDPEEYQELWWPYTYGKSRERSGMRTPGEGSSGDAWAEAATTDGTFFVLESPGLPAFREVEGWLQLDERTEIKWSDGDDFDPKYNQLAKAHLFKGYAKLRSADDCVAALANGYNITQASNFGFRSSKVVGTPPVRIAPWDGSWSHQTYVDEFWEHPTERMIFRWGNNWGPRAHGDPTGDEPPGGVYIQHATMDRICKTGEVYAFYKYDGFQARNVLDWFSIWA